MSLRQCPMTEGRWSWVADGISRKGDGISNREGWGGERNRPPPYQLHLQWWPARVMCFNCKKKIHPYKEPNLQRMLLQELLEGNLLKATVFIAQMRRPFSIEFGSSRTAWHFHDRVFSVGLRSPSIQNWGNRVLALL
ncbi:hypothetical protein AVEN_78026-1 [Araneus ventricosus]|uniref:Uncharacterized protein n=1 Tax=Araneus ventricosus TaxID=182803 RepID=A0A4Y2U103_ARAVE|nr:hypothetical protein AVEN_78026-1 [Araneus ventricosus]